MIPAVPQPAIEQDANEERLRAEHYAVISALFFRAPDEGMLALLQRISVPLSAGPSALADAWRGLSEAACGSPQAIADEFATLFQSVGRPQVMPYGSFYRAGFLMEEPLAELRDDLAELGLGRRSGITESEDHISALCDVMRHLVLTGLDEAGIALQKKFFLCHLASWHEGLCSALETAPQSTFYRRVAALTRAFFDVERTAFELS